jgi:hypothetical protein
VEILKEKNMIFGGDLNFTTSGIEVWGEHARTDPLKIFFNHMFQAEGLVHVEPHKVFPTW